MDIDDPVLNENLTYGSPKIFERRRRILETARLLIAERGYDGFGIRELCERASVAPQTVYKAFESKERIIALAIRHHFQLFAKQQAYHFDKASLEGVHMSRTGQNCPSGDCIKHVRNRRDIGSS